MKSIKLKKEGNFFSTRYSAHEVFDDVDNESSILIDFEGVEDVTPSFLHELLCIMSDKRVTFEMKNMNNSVSFQYEKAQKAFLTSIEKDNPN